MARETPPRIRSGRRRRWPRVLLRSLAILLGLGGLLYLARARLVAPIVLEVAGRALGGELTVREVHGDWFSSLRLEGLDFRHEGDAPAPTPLVRLSGARLEARYSLWGRLRGDLDWVEAVTLQAEGLACDWTALAPADAAEEEDADRSGASFEPPDATGRLPEIDLRVARAELRFSPTAELELTGLRAHGSTDGSLELAIEPPSWNGSVPPALAEGVNATARLGDGRLEVERIELAPELALRGLLAERDAALGWRIGVELELAGGQVALTAALGGERSAHVEARDVDLARLADLARSSAEETSVDLAGELDAEGDVSLDPREPTGWTARLELEARGLQSRGLAFDLAQATLVVADGSATLRALDARSGPNRLTAREVAWPLGGGDEPDRLAAALRNAHGELALTIADLSASSSAASENLPEHRVELRARLGDGVLEVRRATLRSAGGDFTSRAGRFALGPPGAPWRRARVDVDLAFAFEDLAELGRLVGDDWNGTLEGRLVLAGTPGELEGRVDGEARDVILLGWRVDEGRVEARVDTEGLVVEALHARAPGADVSVHGRWDFGADVLDDVVVEAHADDLAALSGGRFAGEARIDVRAEGPRTAPLGEFSLATASLSLADRSFRDVELRGRFEGERVVVESAHGRMSRIAPGEGAAGDEPSAEPGSEERPGEREIAFAGTVEREAPGTWAVLVREAQLSDPTNEYRATEPVRLRIAGPADGRSITLDAPGLADRAGSAGLALALTSAASPAGEGARRLELRAELEAFDPTTLLRTLPGTLLPPGWRLGPLEGSLELETSPDAGLRTVATLAADDLSPAADEPGWTVRVDGRVGGGRVDLETLDLRRNGAATLTVRGSAPLLPLAPLAVEESADGLLPAGPVELRLEFDAETLEHVAAWLPPTLRRTRDSNVPPDASGTLGHDRRFPWPTGRARTSLQLGGSWRRLVGRAALVASNLVVAGPEGGEDLQLGELDVELELAERILLRQGSLASPLAGDVSIEGELGGRLDLPALLAGESALLDAPLDVRGRFALDDVAPLVRGLREIRRAAGSLEGQLALRGSPREPRFEGELDLSDGAMRLAADFPPIEALVARLAFSDGIVRIEGLQGELGASPFRLEGSVDLSGFEPELDLRLVGENVLLARRPGMRLRADADVSVAGPLGRLETTGDVVLTDGYFGRDYELLGFLRQDRSPTVAGRGFSPSFWRHAPLAAMRFDVSIRSEETFRVKNNVLASEIRPSLRLGGSGEVPVFTGSIFLGETRVTLPSGSLTVDSGVVEFLESDPFHPRLRLSGGMRIRGYDVRVDMSGPFDEPEITLSSTPPLASEDLLLLFLTGELPAERSSDRNERALQSVASYLARDFFVRRFAGESDGSSFFDRIDFEIGSEVSVSGETTARVQFYLDERPKDLGWVPYLSAERDRYDKINFGIGVLFRLR